MKFVTIDRGGERRLGVETGGSVTDVARALEKHPAAGVPADVMEVIAGGETVVERLRDYIAALPDGSGTFAFAPDEIEYGPCVARPGKIVCVGLNYRRHAEETGATIPAYPILFSKFNNALTGHGKLVALPGSVTDEVDYEAELAIVIGKRAKHVGEDEALDYVFGYCNANDLSARDLQMRTPQWLLGKSCDDFCPLGPWLVTADEVGDPNRLSIACKVNGETRQQSDTSDMIFSCEQIVSYVSRHMTLDPGDVILTGTPEGVMLGYPADRRVYLQPGDVVEVEIEKLGKLVNRMKGESAD